MIFILISLYVLGAVMSYSAFQISNLIPHHEKLSRGEMVALTIFWPFFGFGVGIGAVWESSCALLQWMKVRR